MTPGASFRDTTIARNLVLGQNVPSNILFVCLISFTLTILYCLLQYCLLRRFRLRRWQQRCSSSFNVRRQIRPFPKLSTILSVNWDTPEVHLRVKAATRAPYKRIPAIPENADRARDKGAFRKHTSRSEPSQSAAAYAKREVRNAPRLLLGLV